MGVDVGEEAIAVASGAVIEVLPATVRTVLVAGKEFKLFLSQFTAYVSLQR